MTKENPWSSFRPLKEESPVQQQTTQQVSRQEDSNDPWKSFVPLEEESALKSGLRTAYQPFGGFIGSTAPALAAETLALAGQGEAISGYNELEERIPELQRLFPNAPWENFKGMNREEWMKNTGSQYFPTQSNIERGIENLTGAPLEAKTSGQKLTRLGSTAFNLRAGDLTQEGKFVSDAAGRAIEKTASGLSAPAISSTLQAAGVPEQFSDMVALGASQFAPVPKSIPTGQVPILNEAGMPTRKFHSITEKTTVSPSAKAKVADAIESDFRTKAETLFSEGSPTYQEMKTNPGFRDERIAGMQNVEEAASKITRQVNTKDVHNEFVDIVNKRLDESGGFASSEYEREYLKEVRKLQKGTPINEKINPTQLNRQYRKVNVDRGKTFELGSSTARNEAKQAALRDYNQSIQNIIEKKYSQTEYANLFSKENKAWSAMEDASKANHFMDKIFTDKGINFKYAEKVFSDKNLSRSLKNVVGPAKFKELQTATREFINQGNKFKLLKEGKEVGAFDMLKDLTLLGTRPLVGRAALAKDSAGLFKGSRLANIEKSTTWTDLPIRSK